MSLFNPDGTISEEGLKINKEAQKRKEVAKRKSSYVPKRRGFNYFAEVEED